MSKPTESVHIAAYFESINSYSLANRLLIETKEMFDKLPSKEERAIEFKKLYSLDQTKITRVHQHFCLWMAIRWNFDFGNVNIVDECKKLRMKGYQQLKRNILSDVVRIEKKPEGIETAFLQVCNELDLENAKRIQSIVRLRKIDSPDLNLTMDILISLLEHKFEKILEIIKDDKKKSERFFIIIPLGFLYVYEKTNQFKRGVELASEYVGKFKKRKFKLTVIKDVMSYIFSVESNANLAIKFLNDIVVGDESLKEDDQYKIMQIIVYLYYKKYRELDKALSSPDVPKDILKEKCLDEFIESARNDFLPKGNPKVLKNKKRIVEMHGTCFGRNQYIEDLFTIGLPSLLSTPDFTMLKDKYDLRIHIDTTEECQSIIDEKIKFLRDLGVTVTVDSSVLLSNSVARNRLGIAFHKSIERCYVDNAIYVNMPPDAIYGHGIFTMCENCPEGGAAGGGVIRSSALKARLFMKTNSFVSLLKSKDRNEHLAKLALSEWRNDFQRYYNSPFSPYTNLFIEDQQLFLNQPFGAILFAKPDRGFMKMLNKSWCPRYGSSIGGSAWDMYMQSYDHNLPIILAEKGLYYGAKSTDEWILCELTADDGYIPQLKGIHPLKSLSVLSLEKQKEITKRPYKINIENSIFPPIPLLI